MHTYTYTFIHTCICIYAYICKKFICSFMYYMYYVYFKHLLLCAPHTFLAFYCFAVVYTRVRI